MDLRAGNGPRVLAGRRGIMMRSADLAAAFRPTTCPRRPVLIPFAMRRERRDKLLLPQSQPLPPRSAATALRIASRIVNQRHQLRWPAASFICAAQVRQDRRERRSPAPFGRHQPQRVIDPPPATAFYPQPPARKFGEGRRQGRLAWEVLPPIRQGREVRRAGAAHAAS